VNASTPRPAAGVLERGPEFRVVGKFWMCRQIFARGTLLKNQCAFLGGNFAAGRADEIHASFQFISVDDDANRVALAQFSNRATSQRLRADVTNARAGRNAAEARVGDERDVFAEGQMLE